MNKKRILIMALGLALAFTAVGALSACNDKPDNQDTNNQSVSLTYTGGALAAARVGSAYNATVATASGADGITYSLKSGNSLPAGLTLSSDGAVSGTPTATGESKFTVVASKSGATSAEAKFSITVVAADADIPEEYIFEAEFVDVTGLQGATTSGALAGLDLVLPTSTASNGYYIGATHKTGFTIKFEIESEGSDSKAKLAFNLSTELGNINMSPSTFIVKVNGKEVDYNEFTVKNSKQVGFEFSKYEISTPVTLNEGKNTITVTIGANEYANGGTGGPMIDNMIISSTAKLTWNPIESNIE